MSQGINISHLPKSLQRDIYEGEMFRQQMLNSREVEARLARFRLPGRLLDQSKHGSYAAARAALGMLLVWIFAAACALAQVAVPPNVVAATATIKNCTGNQCLQGSATLVDKGNGRGLVLTTGHLLDIGQGKLTVTFPGFNPVAGELLGYDALLDVAAVEVPAPPIEPLDLADNPPDVGSTIHALGYGSGRLSGTTGKLLGYFTQQDEKGTAFPAGAIITTSGVTTAGDSGGPMLDQHWKVCGVIMGTNRRSDIDGAACPLVRRFLDRFRPRYRARAAAPANAAGQRPYSRTPVAAAPPYNSHQPTPPAAAPAQPNLPEPAPAPMEDGNSGPAAWIAERAALEQNHAAQMNARSAELAELQKRIAGERADFENRIRAANAPKQTQVSTPDPRSESQTPAGLDDAARMIATKAVSGLLVSFGVPFAGVASPLIIWLASRRLRAWWNGRQPDEPSQPVVKGFAGAEPAADETAEGKPPTTAKPRRTLRTFTDRTANILVPAPSPEVEGEAYREAARRLTTQLGRDRMTFAQFLEQLEGTKDLLLQGMRTEPSAWKTETE